MPPVGFRVAPIVLLAAVCLTARGAAAQVVMGRTVDAASGRPLSGVRVRLHRAAPADTQSLAEATTAADGAFSLFAPDSGRYQVRIGAGFVGPVLTLGRDGEDQHLYPVPSGAAEPVPGADRVYDEGEVELRARWVPNTGEPPDAAAIVEAHPTMYRAVSFRATVEFVVGTDGRAERGSVRLLRSDDHAYGPMAVRQVETARFDPASAGGRAVRQRVRTTLTARVEVH